MRNITRTARMIMGSLALLVGFSLLALLGLAAVLLPALLGILAIELSRVAPLRGWRPGAALANAPNNKGQYGMTAMKQRGRSGQAHRVCPTERERRRSTPREYLESRADSGCGVNSLSGFHSSL